MAERIGQQLGNYRLLHLIGRGGFADVYMAEHIHLNTRAAIKVLRTELSSDNVEKFHTEARTLATLIHPHIVRIVDFGVKEGIPFLVMDYAPNGTLSQRHPKGTPVPPLTIIPYVKQVASALQYAHDKRLIHRDVKPENMLVGQREEILLSDFGLVLVTHSQSSEIGTIQEMAGTVGYMAPEQLQGKPRPASDQYALGIVVYEWLSGDRPFHGSFYEIATQHILTPPPPLREKVPDIPSEIEQVVLTALEKDPHKRFASIEEFATAFEQVCRSEPLHPSLYRTAPLPSSEPSSEIDPAPSSDYSTQQNDETNLVVEPQPLSRGISRRRVIMGAGLTLASASLTWFGLSRFSRTSLLIPTPTPHPTVTTTPSAGPPPVSGTPTVLADGLQYIDIKVGTGPAAQVGNTLSTEYTGWLASNNQKFDSSYERNSEPVTFTLGQGQVIKGWEEGLIGVKAGGTRRLIIPPSLAYGEQGAGPIPPNATLIFDVTVLSVK